MAAFGLIVVMFDVLENGLLELANLLPAFSIRAWRQYRLGEGDTVPGGIVPSRLFAEIDFAVV